jgi:predicted nucleic acid-binding protein
MSRPSLVTLDSNILVYAVQAGDPRQFAALELLRLAAGGSCVLTLQALGEFFFAATRKGMATRSAAAAQVRRWSILFPSPVAASATALEAAMNASVEGRFSYWDALLLATAAEAGCGAAISEDMAAGAVLGSIRVVPAFADGGVSPAARALL